MSKEMSFPSNNNDQRHQQRLSSSTVSSNASDGQDDDDTSHHHRRHPSSSGDDVSAALHPPQVVSPAHLRPRNPLTVNTRHVGNHAHNHIHHGHHGQGSLRQHSVSPGGQATPAVVGTSTVSPPTGVIALSGSVGSSGSKTVTFFDQVPPPTPPPPFAGQLSGSTGQSSGPLDASATLPADDMSSSSPPSDLQRVRDLEHEVRELSRQLRLLRSREHLSAVSSVTSGHNIRPSSASSHMAPSLSSSFGGGGGGGNHVDPSTMSSSHRHAAAGSPTHSHHPSATTARSPSEPSSVAAGSMFPVDDAVPSSTTPYIMTSMHKPLVASTSGGTIIGLPVSYLDPNLAPYVVGLQNTNALLPQHAPTANRQSSTSGEIDNNTISSDNGGSDYHLVPCTVVERRMILFVAPASSRGSAAVFILCTHDGCLRRYTRSVWIEYRSPHESTTTSTSRKISPCPRPPRLSTQVKMQRRIWRGWKTTRMTGSLGRVMGPLVQRAMKILRAMTAVVVKMPAASRHGRLVIRT
ncbi:Hypothetical protein, putative [Bodo saltans]|uniref:Uncharacterized protein n=1 Tax=Bodo saltans TaxID=75058 RepID=A0A0S4J8V1_BODSA|nr:Hypothetical protein, putative [Bodo saltans]|eukprot:CUG86326.1 Hypothetical protein, putative [Bodo saltans]